MGTMDFPNEKFLQKKWVQAYIKQKYEIAAIWEQHVTKQPTDALSVLYYQEDYVNIESPNDTALSNPIDTTLRRPAYRAAGGLFAKTEYSHIVEKNAGLHQLALQGSVTEEAKKYTSMEQPILRMQSKIADSMASEVNRIIGDVLTEEWSTSPTNIQQVGVSSGAEWSRHPSSSGIDPISDILDAIEKVEDLGGYNYTADTFGTSRQSWFDLRKWAYYNDYEFGYRDWRAATTVNTIEGLNVFVSNQVKRDFAIVEDKKAACTLYEAQPLTTDTYFNKPTREYHFQAMRTLYPALTDPKAICTIKNTVA